ncbi:hypothetical protein [Sorangium sp. So ce1151]|uniref:hypothetical protein n=1 Tax=Sorangium sp. So ce1151 TaxID=3133332 RepID=UPI003F5F3A2F
MLAQIVSWRPEAPQGIARNGKYYLYVPLNNATGAKAAPARRVARPPGGRGRLKRLERVLSWSALVPGKKGS